MPPQGVVAQALSGAIGTQPLVPGATLQSGRYVIDRALGKGGMGSVFLARDTHVNNKLVVIKEMANLYATEEERREAEADFQSEMATLAGLSHPNIPQISDFFSESNRHFAVQEYVAGQDLEKAIAAVQIAGQPPQGIPERQVLSWVSQILSVLDYLEAQDPQVIHRDIKPANILVDASNRVRVVDFGIASHKFKPGSNPTAGQQVSTALGTPGYAPKEQFTGQETTLSDLYALGATMHHLLTGRDPTKIQPLWQYPPLRALNPKISEATERIVARALQNDEKKRYQTAAEMKKEVDRIVHPPSALSTFRGRTVALAIVLLLLVGVAGGVFVYTQIQAQQPATGFVSDGQIAFDTVPADHPFATNGQQWASIKSQAALDWKNNRHDTAAGEYGKATDNDRTDAESWIYQANQQALSSGATPYNVAVAGSFSGADSSSGREILQGAYTAQKEINANGGINGHPLVLVLANDASRDDGALQSARKLAARTDILGVVGYRTSARTALAVPALAGAGIPIVSPTASNPNVGNGSPFFFRVCPSDTFQAAQAVRYMLGTLVPVGTFNASVALFTDPNDQYSNTLTGVIQQDIQTLGGTPIQETYTVGGSNDFTAAARDLVNRKASVIYFAGYAREALQLARALDAIGAPSSLKIMTDQEFYNPAEFVAQKGHKDRFYFTAFFYPDVYSRVILPPAQQLIQRVEGTYKTTFQSPNAVAGSYGSDRLPSGTALSYDTLQVLAQAIKAAGAGGATPTGRTVRDALATIGPTAPRYQGITGPVAFAGNGDPINKTILILHLDSLGRTHMDGFLTDGWLGQYG